MSITAIAALCLAMCGCSEKNEEEYRRNIFSMDTVMNLTVYSADGEKALDKAEEKINALNSLFNRNDTNSEVYRINHSESCTVSEDTTKVIDKAIEISERTDGAFDMTIAPVMDLWGFYGQNYRIPADEEINDALKRVDYKNIITDGNNITKNSESEIDLGGIAKGYASDCVADILRENDVKSAVISLGGNIFAIGTKHDGSKWRIAVQSPFGNEEYVGTVNVENKAVVTSGGYQRYFESNGETYHHILDPKTGTSARSGLASVTIISESGTLADGLSTALFVMGLEKSEQFYMENRDFEAVLVSDDNEVYVTAGIADDFQADKEYHIIGGGSE